MRIILQPSSATESGSKLGNLDAKGGGRWEWSIPKFSDLPRRKDDFFRSSLFDPGNGESWWIRLYPNGTTGDDQIHITLCRKYSRNWKHVRCTVGVVRIRRGTRTEVTVGTQTTGQIPYSSYILEKTRGELEVFGRGWLPFGWFTVILHFAGAHESQGNVQRFFHLATQRKQKETQAVRMFKVSRETQTDASDVEIGKGERLEDGTGAEGVMQLSENLKGLLTEENDDYDVTILVKGKEFRAHKCILKARSPVLGMLLKRDSEENKSSTIQIEDCDPDCFNEFLLFVYCGRAENLTTSKAISLYHAADKFDLPLLKKQCVQFLEASLTAASLCEVALLASKHGEEQLLRTAAEYFEKNQDTILSTVDWQHFLAQVL